MKIYRPPVADISANLNSTEKEQAPQCGIATIEVADEDFLTAGGG